MESSTTRFLHAVNTRRIELGQCASAGRTSQEALGFPTANLLSADLRNAVSFDKRKGFDARHSSASANGYDLTPHAQLVKIVRPCLHHLSPLPKPLRLVVGGANLIPLGVSQL